MENEKQNISKSTGLHFMLLYAVSLALIFIVVSAFFKRDDMVSTSAYHPDEGYEKNIVQIDTFLQSKLQLIDKSYIAYLNSNRQPDNKEAGDVLSAKNGLFISVDSIEKTAAGLREGPARQSILQTVNRFKTAYQTRDSLFYSLVLLPKGTIPNYNVSTQGNSNTELETLKGILVEKEQRIAELEKSKPTDLQEKDKLIASLQNQLKRKEATQTTGSDDGEWKQKYSSLKQAYDKTSASERSLKSAYQTVVDDNKRLLNQLQTLRKG